MVRGAGGVALAGACVTAIGPSGTVPGLTTAGGRYVITGLLPGRYTVSYSDCGRPGQYFSQWYGGSGLASGLARVLVTVGLPTVLRTVTLRVASTALLVAAARATERQVAIRPSGPATAGRPSLSGTVRTVSGKGLAGLCVGITNPPGNAPTSVGMQTMTGRGGRYSFPGGRRSTGRWVVNFFTGCRNQGNFAPQW